MSKYKKIIPLSPSNEIFLKYRKLTLKDVADFFNMKPVTLRNSTAKNRYIDALRKYQNFIDIKSKENLTEKQKKIVKRLNTGETGFSFDLDGNEL